MAGGRSLMDAQRPMVVATAHRHPIRVMFAMSAIGLLALVLPIQRVRAVSDPPLQEPQQLPTRAITSADGKVALTGRLGFSKRILVWHPALAPFQAGLRMMHVK